MSSQDEPQAIQKRQFTKMVSGMDEFLQLENQLNSAPVSNKADIEAQAKFTKLASPSKISKETVDNPKRQLFAKHHYPVTPLLFGKGSPETLNQIRTDLMGINTKTVNSSKPTANRQTEAKISKRLDSSQKESAVNRPSSSQRKDIHRTPKIGKNKKLEQISAISSSKKDSTMPNSSILSLNTDISGFRAVSTNKSIAKLTSNDQKNSKRHTNNIAASDQKATRNDSRNKLNLSVGLKREIDLDQASKNKLIANMRSYYQNQITQVLFSYLGEP